MKGIGIVCEFNPFHNGHEYVIKQAKKQKNCPVVCVLSSDFVQRGSVAILDTQTRAKMAIKAGADVVLSLPFPFSSMSAEIYAESAVKILAQSALCDSIFFGSECEELQKLKKIADILDNDGYAKIKQIQKADNTKSFAVARSEFIENSLGKEYCEISKTPNNILAIEYLRAICRNKYELEPFNVHRTGAMHNQNQTFIHENKKFASASYIRQLLMQKDFQKTKELVPEYVYDEICQNGVNFSNFEQFIYAALHLKSCKELGNIAEISGGIEHVIKKELKSCQSYEALAEALKSKSVTNAKITRALLFCAIGVQKQYTKTRPLYTQILQVSNEGKKLLRHNSKNASIILASRVSHIKRDKQAYEQYCFGLSAENALRAFDNIIYKD